MVDRYITHMTQTSEELLKEIEEILYFIEEIEVENDIS